MAESPLGTRKFQYVALFGLRHAEHIPKNGMFDDLTDIELCIPLEWGSNRATF